MAYDLMDQYGNTIATLERVTTSPDLLVLADGVGRKMWLNREQAERLGEVLIEYSCQAPVPRDTTPTRPSLEGFYPLPPAKPSQAELIAEARRKRLQDALIYTAPKRRGDVFRTV